MMCRDNGFGGSDGGVIAGKIEVRMIGTKAREAMRAQQRLRRQLLRCEGDPARGAVPKSVREAARWSGAEMKVLPAAHWAAARAERRACPREAHARRGRWV